MVRFDSFSLPQEILTALDEMGFEDATPIQDAVITRLMEGRDVVGQAQTGTGKTAAFGIPLIVGALDDKLSIVLAPTRELAQQVAAEVDRIGKHADVHAIPIYGGAPFGHQARDIKSGRFSVLVATPGRLRDHIDKGTFDPAMADIVVLDEADEMLKMGFVEEVEEILKAVGAQRQTLLFSATMPGPIARLAEKYMRDPEHVSVEGANRSVAAEATEQFAVFAPVRQKLGVLHRLLIAEDPVGALIFRHTREGVDELATQLKRIGIRAEGLHGGMAQPQREAALARLRHGESRVIVATDVAARGLDVDRISHVFNYEAPREAEVYVHRIGRTGRAGRAGRSFLLMAPSEKNRVRAIERVVGHKIEIAEPPTDSDIERAMAQRTRQWLRTESLQIDARHMQLIEELVAEGADAKALATKLLGAVAQEKGFVVPRLDPVKRTPAHDPNAKPTGGPMAALVLGAGKFANVRPADVVGMLTNEGGLIGADVGRIDILPKMSVVEVPESRVADLMDTLRDSTMRGVPVQPRLADNWTFRAGNNASRPASRPHHAKRPGSKRDFSRPAYTR